MTFVVAVVVAIVEVGAVEEAAADGVSGGAGGQQRDQTTPVCSRTATRLAWASREVDWDLASATIATTKSDPATFSFRATAILSEWSIISARSS
jgi:hypothetical protein